MLPLLVVTISFPFTSKSPPNCGDVSETMSVLPRILVKSTLPDCPVKLITLPDIVKSWLSVSLVK